MEVKTPCCFHKGIEIFSDHYKFFYFKDKKMIVDKNLQAIKRSIDGTPERFCVGQIYKVSSGYGVWITMLAQVGSGYIAAIVVQGEGDNPDIGNRCNQEPVHAKAGCNDISLEEMNELFGEGQTFEYLPNYKVTIVGK